MIKTTLGYIEHNGRYLMLLRNKKKEDVNAGKWIGVGGHVEQGETPDECFVREVREETGIELTDFTKRGVIQFYQDKEKDGTVIPGDTEEMHLYTACVASDSFGECNEGTLKWIPVDEVLNLNLWEGDIIFLKRLLAGDMNINLRLEYLNDTLTKVIEL